MAASTLTNYFLDTRSQPTRLRSGRDRKHYDNWLGGRGIQHSERMELVVPVITQTEGLEIFHSTGAWGGGAVHGPLRQIDVDALNAAGHGGLLILGYSPGPDGYQDLYVDTYF